MKVDFHVHSNASDGFYPPAEVARKAAEAGIDILALSDHDTVEGCAEAGAEAAKLGFVNLPACEFSTSLDAREFHILGYFPQGVPHVVADFLEGVRDDRAKRIAIGIENLRKIGIPITPEAVHSIARGDVVSRAHIARILVELGFVKNIPAAFHKYLSPKHGIVPLSFRSPDQVIEMLASAGAIPVWAHPDADIFEKYLDRFADLGMRGVEVFNSRRKDSKATRMFEQGADEYGLVKTIGSDWHGLGKDSSLYGFEIPADKFRPFLELFPKYIPPESIA